MTCRFCNKIRMVLRSVGVPIPLLVEKQPDKCKTVQECVNRKRQSRYGGVKPCDGCQV